LQSETPHNSIFAHDDEMLINQHVRLDVGRQTRQPDGPPITGQTREIPGQRHHDQLLSSCRAITMRWIWLVPS